jgi:hypothetical protein
LILHTEVEDARTTVNNFKNHNNPNPLWIEDAEAQVSRAEERVKAAEHKLGGEFERQALQAAQNDKYVANHLRALAVKVRIFSHLLSRMFEASRLDGGSHRPQHGKPDIVHTLS